MLCNVLEKYHCFPGFALLLGSLLWYTTTDQPIFLIAPGIAASLFFVREQQGHILGDVGFSGVWRTTSHNYTSQMGTEEFCAYLAELLENPGRSRTYVFDQKRYATAAKECLELCLCSRRNFSKGATESAFRDNGLRRSKPWAWITRLGVHGRIRKARQHLVRQQKLRTVIDQFASLSENSPEHEYYRCLAYGWALDLLPFLLEKSDFSLELADVLRSRTFTTMAEEFPRRRRLAKEAIRKYLVRVESAVGDS
jgi:hypothetical protein